MEAANKNGGSIWNWLMPHALIAIISLSEERRPKTKSDEKRRAKGIEIERNVKIR